MFYEVVVSVLLKTLHSSLKLSCIPFLISLKKVTYKCSGLLSHHTSFVMFLIAGSYTKVQRYQNKMNIILLIKSNLHDPKLPIPLSYIQFQANGVSSVCACSCQLDCFLSFVPIQFLISYKKIYRNFNLPKHVELPKMFFKKLYFGTTQHTRLLSEIKLCAIFHNFVIINIQLFWTTVTFYEFCNFSSQQGHTHKSSGTKMQ